MATRSPTTDDAHSKAVLFCPECGHESPVAGDWVVREEPEGLVYDCPICGMTITTRNDNRRICHC
jgi:predicted RNA-binding Zn-ribbon protein involved in translation (DUF1610 family)